MEGTKWCFRRSSAPQVTGCLVHLHPVDEAAFTGGSSLPLGWGIRMARSVACAGGFDFDAARGSQLPEARIPVDLTLFWSIFLWQAAWLAFCGR